MLEKSVSGYTIGKNHEELFIIWLPHVLAYTFVNGTQPLDIDYNEYL